MRGTGRFQLQVMGGFRLVAPDGQALRIASRKGMALIAMLATARNGERTRIWLQDRLWGSREASQAQASLRRELANLRMLLGDALIAADHAAVRLDLDRLHVDVRDEDTPSRLWGDLLEGMDIGEEGFEEWLRDQRARIAAGDVRPTAAPPPPSLPAAAEHLHGRPVIAVSPIAEALPQGAEIVLDGVVDMLTDRLSRLRWMTVIAPRYSSSPAHPAAAGGETDDIDYLLQCRFVTTATGRALHLALSQPANGRLLWSRRFPFPPVVDAPALATIAGETVAVLSSRVQVDQQLRALDRGIATLRPNELVWRARWHMRRLTRADSETAAGLLDEAARISPNDVDVHIEQTFLAAWRVWSMRGDDAEKQALLTTAMRARDLDPFDARGYFLCGVARFWLRQHAEAAALLNTAIELNPSMANAYGQLGSCHSLSGRPDAALPLLETALRLDPFGLENFHQYGEIALANFMLGRQEQAVMAANEALARRPVYLYAHVIRIAALGEMNARDQEVAARRTLAAAKPELDPDMLEWLPFKDRHWIDRLRTALDPGSMQPAG